MPEKKQTKPETAPQVDERGRLALDRPHTPQEAEQLDAENRRAYLEARAARLARRRAARGTT